MGERIREIGHLIEVTSDGRRVYKFKNGFVLDTSKLSILSIRGNERMYSVGEKTGKRLSCRDDGDEAILYTV